MQSIVIMSDDKEQLSRCWMCLGRSRGWFSGEHQYGHASRHRAYTKPALTATSHWWMLTISA